MTGSISPQSASAKLLADMLDLDVRITALNLEARQILRRMTLLELEAATLRARSDAQDAQ